MNKILHTNTTPIYDVITETHEGNRDIHSFYSYNEAREYAINELKETLDEYPYVKKMVCNDEELVGENKAPITNTPFKMKYIDPMSEQFVETTITRDEV